MIIKQTPQDFIVDEIFDLEIFKDKDEDRKQPYYYFKLTKTNYNQLRALQIIANTFNTSKKLVHFAGTKDKVGITSQLVSVYGINEEIYEKNLEYFNSQEDLHLELLGKFKSRINLGDNLGNKFSITVRDIEQQDFEIAKKNIKKIEKGGVLNFFDEQRFGYANNSHIVGKYILKNEVENAVYEILTSLPTKTQSELLTTFVNFIKSNWQQIKEQNIEIINQAIELAPNYLDNEKQMLNHLTKHKNDFPGSFRKIHKKLRTLYINAYQSYIFNETILQLDKNNNLDKYEQLSLISNDIQLDENIKPIVDNLLEKDNLTLDNFKLASMPELKIYSDIRKVKNFPKNIKLNNLEQDELNENKFKVLITFDLDSGEYATNVIKQIFYK